MFTPSLLKKILFSLTLFISLDLILGSIYLSKSNLQPFKARTAEDAKNWNRIQNKFFHHGLLPNTAVTYTWGSDQYEIFVNSLGLRDKIIRKIPQQSDQYRILILGDSFVEGMGLPYEQTFVGLLDKELSIKNISVLNGGVQSYSPKLYYLKAKYLIEKEKLNLNEVIILIDMSDMLNEVAYYQDFSPDYDSINEIEKKPPQYTLTEKVFGFFTDHSIFSNLIYTQVQKAAPPPWKESEYDDVIENWSFDQNLFNVYGAAGLNLSAQYLHQLIDLCHNNQINNISLVVYPWPETIRQDSVDSIQVKFWEQFAKQNNLSFVNLFPNFFQPDYDRTKFLSDGEHWNAGGHQIVADSISQVLGLSTRSAQIQ